MIDIRKQFPLDRSITLSVAEKLKIKHPSVTDAQTGEQIAHWMTTDLLIDYYDKQDQRQQLAIYLKPAEDLKGANLEKLIIECIYWALRGARKCLPQSHFFKFGKPSNNFLITTEATHEIAGMVTLACHTFWGKSDE